MARKSKKFFSLLSAFFEDMPFGKYISKAVEGWINKNTGAGLTPAEREANAFTERMNNENWDRQVQFYHENESLAARVRQYEELGLNKAGLVGAPVASAPSSSGASSVSPSSGSLSDILALAMLPAQIRNLNASARQKDSQSELNEIEAFYRPELLSTRIDSVIASTDEARQRIATGQADEALKRAGLSKAEAETALLWNEVAALQMDVAHKSALHQYELRRADLQNQLIRAQVSSVNADTRRTKRLLSKELEELDAKTRLLKQEALTEARRRLSMDDNDAYIRELTKGVKDENERKALVDRILSARTDMIEFANSKKIEMFETGQFLDFVDALSDEHNMGFNVEGTYEPGTVRRAHKHLAKKVDKYLQNHK